MIRMRGKLGPKEAAIVFQGLSFLVIGTALTYFAYVWGSVSLNMGALVGSILFWYAIVLLLFAFPLRGAFKIFLGNVRRALVAVAFVFYLVIHVFLYGFLLDAIFASVYGVSSLTVAPSIFVTTNVFYPPSLLSALLGLSYNPSINVILTPVLSAVLSFYGVSVALVIGVLFVANIAKAGELGKLCTAWGRARSLVVLPALGIVLGASCCLSVPFLIAFAVPSIAVLTSIVWLFYLTYFIFPPFAIAVLCLNLYSIEKISAKAAPMATGRLQN
ncbi:MAG TPA: hypothetical protein VK487_05600 [Candidatus Bathyarchaeia archaeon]|nr:hypothetical protein [Candidatus Bathyarchaeia archaeon]